MTAKKFKSDAFEAIHTTASARYRTGTIDKAAVREFDESCLFVAPEIKPAQIKKLREKVHLSQPVFARYLNTSASTVRQWEMGKGSLVESLLSSWPLFGSTAWAY